MAKRIKQGDVIEIATKRGLAYSQYVVYKEQWGALIRVLPGFFDRRPPNICEIVKKPEQFVTFFPLQAAVNRKIFEVIDNCEIPASGQRFPLFRAAGHIDREGRVHDWWLWDGDKEWRIGKLTVEQSKLPIRSVLNDSQLIKDIEDDWTPQTDRRTLASM